jgi:hypothetical protein
MPAVARPWTVRRTSGAFVELLGVVPAAVDGGVLTFVRGDLLTTLRIWKYPDDRAVFGWTVFTDDAALRERMADFGGVSVEINPPLPPGAAEPGDVPPLVRLPWPTGAGPLAPDVAAGVARHGPAALGFVRDRHDLGLLLLAATHVHRDGVSSFAPAYSEPARLAKAIVLARHAGDVELERRAVAKLRARGEEPVGRWSGHRFRHTVADWALKYAKATGVDLGDLVALGGEHPQYPEAP